MSADSQSPAERIVQQQKEERERQSAVDLVAAIASLEPELKAAGYSAVIFVEVAITKGAARPGFFQDAPESIPDASQITLKLTHNDRTKIKEIIVNSWKGETDLDRLTFANHADAASYVEQIRTQLGSTAEQVVESPQSSGAEESRPSGETIVDVRYRLVAMPDLYQDLANLLADSSNFGRWIQTPIKNIVAFLNRETQVITVKRINLEKKPFDTSDGNLGTFKAFFSSGPFKEHEVIIDLEN